MSSLRPMKRDLAPAPQSSNRLLQILGGGAALALLYVGRGVLIPVTLAVILSLLMVPFVRRLESLGLGRTASTWVGVFTVAATLLTIAVVIASQLVQIRSNLPQYNDTIRSKLASLHEVTVARVQAMLEPAGRATDRPPVEKGSPPESRGQRPSTLSGAFAPIPVEMLFSRILSWIWPTLETTGIVFFLLVPVLLERDALGRRFTRLLGATELQLVTAAINDAGERLSRFFVLQLAVHLLVGMAIWAGLAVLGLSHSVLLAALTVVLRFIPYAGVWVAALCATSFAAAVDPGWSLAIMTLSLFVTVELIVSHLVELHLYRHATGLSPLTVVVSTVFWSWIWGPMGLFISTPLTMCLVVAGRYIKAFNTLEVLLGDAPHPSLRPGFYRRALSANEDAFMGRARIFLARHIAGGGSPRADSSRPDSRQM